MAHGFKNQYSVQQAAKFVRRTDAGVKRAAALNHRLTYDHAVKMNKASKAELRDANKRASKSTSRSKRGVNQK